MAGEFFHQGNHDNNGEDVRPDRIESHQGEYADKQPDHPVFIRVTVKHQGCCVLIASPSAPNSCSLRLRKPQEQVQTAKGGLMGAFVSACQLFSGRLKILLPSR